MAVNFWRPMFADRAHFMGDVNETVRAGDRGAGSSARKAAPMAGVAALTGRTDIGIMGQINSDRNVVIDQLLSVSPARSGSPLRMARRSGSGR
jgi:hypothetical protein